MTSENPAHQSFRNSPLFSTALSAVRALLHLGVVIAATVWGFLDWEFPFPAVFTGIGALVLTVVIWALFLSPRPVLHTDHFGHSLIELLFIASGAGSLLALGLPWWIPALFFIVGAVLGYIVPPRTRRQ